MGTRGSWGFRLDGADKLTYNHFDSYPSALGASLVNQLTAMLATNAGGVEWLKERVRTLKLVPQDGKPTYIEKQEYAAFTDKGVSLKGEDWYSVLRELQGQLRLTLEVGVMCDGDGFMQDSLFCEYAYVINLDDGLFEFYRGFQKAKGEGRYAALGKLPDEVLTRGDGTTWTRAVSYWPVSLVKTWPLSALPTEADFLAATEEDVEEEVA
jgi:hypothetical protein